MMKIVYQIGTQVWGMSFIITFTSVCTNSLTSSVQRCYKLNDFLVTITNASASLCLVIIHHKRNLPFRTWRNYLVLCSHFEEIINKTTIFTELSYSFTYVNHCQNTNAALISCLLSVWQPVLNCSFMYKMQQSRSKQLLVRDKHRAGTICYSRRASSNCILSV